MNLTELAHTIVEEGYPIPLDMLANMAAQGIHVDEFINKIEGGWSVEELFDQLDMYGE